MLLLEIFDEKPKGGSVVQDLRDSMLDMLMPLAAQGIPYVTVQAIVDKMSELDSGVSVDRALVMHVLDPAEVKMISKIEGDRVYFGLNNPGEGEGDNANSQSEEEKNAAKVSNMAVDKAKSNMKKQNGIDPAVAANPSTGPF
jgi:hypothetical protein